MTIGETLQQILLRQKAQGTERVWIAPDTLSEFYAAPQPPPMPSTVNKPAAARTIAQQPFAAVPQPQPPAVTPRPSYAMPAAPAPRMDAVSVSASADAIASAVASADWDALKTKAFACTACKLHATRRNVVFEDGLREARLMFIGEGPGEEEDKQGVPFVGRAGQLLTRMITAMGLDRAATTRDKAVYIANIVKCRPPNNRNPEVDEGGVCIGYLKRQIELVKPEVIVLLGNVPLQFLLGKKGITAMRGHWQEYNGIPVMPTFHPAYLLRFENFRDKFREEKWKVWSDLQQVMERLGLPLPKA